MVAGKDDQPDVIHRLRRYMALAGREPDAQLAEAAEGTGRGGQRGQALGRMIAGDVGRGGDVGHGGPHEVGWRRRTASSAVKNWFVIPGGRTAMRTQVESSPGNVSARRTATPRSLSAA